MFDALIRCLLISLSAFDGTSYSEGWKEETRRLLPNTASLPQPDRIQDITNLDQRLRLRLQRRQHLQLLQLVVRKVQRLQRIDIPGKTKKPVQVHKLAYTLWCPARNSKIESIEEYISTNLCFAVLKHNANPKAAASPNVKCASTSSNGSCVTPSFCIISFHAFAFSGLVAHSLSVKLNFIFVGGPYPSGVSAAPGTTVYLLSSVSGRPTSLSLIPYQRASSGQRRLTGRGHPSEALNFWLAVEDSRTAHSLR